MMLRTEVRRSTSVLPAEEVGIWVEGAYDVEVVVRSTVALLGS